MKIEHRGIRITDLPGDFTIDVAMGHRSDGPEITFDSPLMNTELGISIDGAVAIRDALSVLIDHARTMTGVTSPTREPRTWNAGDPEPAGVTKVEDVDGDPWLRRADGKWYLGEYGATPNDWRQLVTDLAPLTEVLS